MMSFLERVVKEQWLHTFDQSEVTHLLALKQLAAFADFELSAECIDNILTGTHTPLLTKNL
jgi:hypothetical protein